MSSISGKKTEPRALRAAAQASAANAEESLRTVVELESDVESLRTRYEQYFLGLSRVPPSEEHQRIRSHLIRLRGAALRSAPVRFRLQSLHNRFLSYERMWARVLREREEGTYRRDLEKARYRRRAAGVQKGEAAGDTRAVKDSAEETARSAADAAASPEGAAPASQKDRVATTGAPRPGGEAPRSEVSDERLRAVYDAYVGAKRRCGEDTKGLTFEGLAKKLRSQLPEVLARHNATSVELKVVIKGGKAMVKAIPK
ncbi:MAG TPA: MXAN_5187 C-terminal domain-containing protein [Vulgatibacter sp.]|nr:MXAN_5187 C-terminal domain-containing protein [Vulgatibacter sp.]